MVGDSHMPFHTCSQLGIPIMAEGRLAKNEVPKPLWDFWNNLLRVNFGPPLNVRWSGFPALGAVSGAKVNKGYAQMA